MSMDFSSAASRIFQISDDVSGFRLNKETGLSLHTSHFTLNHSREIICGFTAIQILCFEKLPFHSKGNIRGNKQLFISQLFVLGVQNCLRFQLVRGAYRVI